MLGTAFRPSAEISFYSVKSKVIRRGVATRQRRGKTAWPLWRCAGLVGDRKWRHERSG
jgi:hypothetical protein